MHRAMAAVRANSLSRLRVPAAAVLQCCGGCFPCGVHGLPPGTLGHTQACVQAAAANSAAGVNSADLYAGPVLPDQRCSIGFMFRSKPSNKKPEHMQAAAAMERSRPRMPRGCS